MQSNFAVLKSFRSIWWGRGRFMLSFCQLISPNLCCAVIRLSSLKCQFQRSFDILSRCCSSFLVKIWTWWSQSISGISAHLLLAIFCSLCWMRIVINFSGLFWILLASCGSNMLWFRFYLSSKCMSFGFAFLDSIDLGKGRISHFLLPMAWSREGCEWFDFRFWATAAGQLSTAPRCSTSYWMCSNLWAFDADAKTSPAGFIDLALRQQSFNRLA